MKRRVSFPSYDGRSWQRLRTNGRVYLSACPFIRSSLGWSLTHIGYTTSRESHVSTFNSLFSVKLKSTKHYTQASKETCEVMHSPACPGTFSRGDAQHRFCWGFRSARCTGQAGWIDARRVLSCPSSTSVDYFSIARTHAHLPTRTNARTHVHTHTPSTCTISRGGWASATT